MNDAHRHREVRLAEVLQRNTHNRQHAVFITVGHCKRQHDSHSDGHTCVMGANKPLLSSTTIVDGLYTRPAALPRMAARGGAAGPLATGARAALMGNRSRCSMIHASKSSTVTTATPWRAAKERTSVPPPRGASAAVATCVSAGSNSL
jgi:hypothetical protein